VPTEIEKKKTRISRFVLSTLFFKRAAHSKISLIDDVTTEVTRRPHPRAKSEIGRDEKKKKSLLMFTCRVIIKGCTTCRLVIFFRRISSQIS
jgi:hypothetical protein